MTISQDSITFDGDTAWLVLPSPKMDSLMPNLIDIWNSFDRPCDTCDGQEYMVDSLVVPPEMIGQPCTADCIDGRHTFDIEVECPVCADLSGLIPPPPEQHIIRRRVSIVPGMVLPIVGPEYGEQFDSHFEGVMVIGQPCLPSAARRPGMWAVQLKVAS